MDAIVKTGHLSTAGAFPIGPSDHENNEKSFEWADDETLESLPSVTSSLQRGDDLDTVTQQAIELLDAYIYRDPLDSLEEFYRNHDIDDISSYFQEKNLNKELYSCTFQCPLRGTYFHSSLPLILFGNVPPHDLLEQLSEKVIGKFQIFHDGVYFYTRKHAKRATALAVLESNETTSTIMYPSAQEALPRLGQLSPTSITSPLGIRNKKPKRYFPAWVHELRNVGVNAKDLHISYQEQYTGAADAAWNEQPTLLACIVSVKTLVELTCVGEPCETKREALESAIGLLVEELQRQLPDLHETEPSSTHELKAMLERDPRSANYLYPLPNWATDAMPTIGSSSSTQKRAIYLYELELKSNQGHALFGIVFPCDPEPRRQALIYETDFDIPGKMGDDTVVARLQKLGTLDVHQLSPHEVEARMSWMKSFNAMATRTRSDNDIEDSPTLPFNRTYLILPLTRTGFGRARRSSVDWKMLRHLWQQSETATSPSSSLRLIDMFLLAVGLLCLVAPLMSDEVKQSGLSLIIFLLTLMVYTLLVHLPPKNPEPSLFQWKMLEYANIFMPKLEREMEVAHFAGDLCDMASPVRAEKSAGLSSDFSYRRSVTLPASVKEATTLVPDVTYKRLELLGDSVLGFFLSVNLMGMNCTLEWDSDDLARILSASANNRALGDAALRSGICRLLFGERHTSIEKSNAVNSLLSIDGIPTGNASDEVLRAVVESLLGVAFLDGNNNVEDASSARMVIALLEHFNLPLPNHGKSGFPFFQAAGSCVKRGYPFNQDKAWRRQLVQIGTTLYCTHEVINRLETGCLKVMENIFSVSSFERHRLLMEKQKAKILLLCSLFNDSLSNLSDEGSFRRIDSSMASVSTLESDLSSNPDSTVTPESGLIRIALLRDTLFMVGHAALSLAVTNELFRLYPDASEEDLSLQRACATSDDVVAYIMIKSGIHKSLYHHNTRSEQRLVSEMGAAEDMGRKIWNRRFGWILKGGKHEYARRRIHLSFSLQGLPRYCGLAGGRLYGHKTKLPDSFTEDLVFSLKAIAGALVLSLGLEGMWQSLGPLFGELLLLSADEIQREYHNNSTIVNPSLF